MLRRTITSLVTGTALTSFSILGFLNDSSANQTYDLQAYNIKKWIPDWDKSHGSYPDSTAQWVSEYNNLNGNIPYRKLVIFIRHGQYELKKKHSHEKVLTDKGWLQAYRTGCRLREMGIRIDRIIHSNLIRAKQTTAAVLAGLNDDIEPLYDSVAYSDLVRPPVHVQKPKLLTVSASTQPNNHDDKDNNDCQIHSPYLPYKGAIFECQESEYLAEGPPPVAPEPLNRTSMSAEERHRLGERIETGFQIHMHRAPITKQGQLACQGRLACPSECCDSLNTGDPNCHCACHRLVRHEPIETIVFIGHANVFRYWLCRLLQLPPEGWLRLSLNHGSMSFFMITHDPTTSRAALIEDDDEFSLGESDVYVSRIGEAGHLPLELLTR